MDNAKTTGFSRRTVVKGAAWSVPVIAAAIAVPMAAASAAPNDLANYYWDTESQGIFTSLVAAASDNKATFSTQISYRAIPWISPPSGGSLVVTVSFSSAVTLDAASALGSWDASPAPGATGTTFIFTRTPSRFGDGLTFNVIGDGPGTLISTASMTVVNGGATTWASESSQASATLIA